MDVNEAARLCGLRPQTLYRLARQGKLRKFTALRRAVRFDREEVLGLVHEVIPPEAKKEVLK